MARYYTAKEIAELWDRPLGTVRRLASEDRWERTEDGKRPVMYYAQDVEKTMNRLDPTRASDRRS